MNTSSSRPPQQDSRLYDPDPFSWAMLALAALSAAGGVAGIASYRVSRKEIQAANRRRLSEKIMRMMDLIHRLSREIHFFMHHFAVGDLEKAIKIHPGIEIFAPLSVALDFRGTHSAIAHLAVEIEDQKTVILAELMNPPWNFQLQEYLEYKSEEFLQSLNKLRTEENLHSFQKTADRYLSLLKQLLSDQLERIR